MRCLNFDDHDFIIREIREPFDTVIQAFMPEHCQPPLPLMYLGAHAIPLSPQKRMRKADYKSEANAQKLQKIKENPVI